MNLNPRIEMPFFERHAESIKISVCIQAILLLLTAIMLDGGDLFKFMLLPAIAYWMALGLIMLRRDMNVTWSDRMVLRWGSFTMLVLVALIMWRAHV